MRLLVDTNVFLDIILHRPVLFEKSKDFLNFAEKNNDEIYISSFSLKDIAYFARKALHNEKLSNNLLISLYSNVDKVLGVSSDDTINSLYSDGDFEDNCLINSALSSMCDAVITNNVKDFVNKGINVFSPEDYIKTR